MLSTIPTSFSTSSDEQLLLLLQQHPHKTHVLVAADGTPLGAWIFSATCSSEPLVTLGEYLLEEALLQVSSPPETLSDAAYQLRPGLVVDLKGYEILQGQIRRRLTACEAELLAIFLQQPRCYVPVEKLIRMTRLRYARHPKRSLQETICDLRRKLGEVPRRPALLRCLEGKAYAIFPQGSAPLKPKSVAGNQQR